MPLGNPMDSDNTASGLNDRRCLDAKGKARMNYLADP